MSYAAIGIWNVFHSIIRQLFNAIAQIQIMLQFQYHLLKNRLMHFIKQNILIRKTPKALLVSILKHNLNNGIIISKAAR